MLGVIKEISSSKKVISMLTSLLFVLFLIGNVIPYSGKFCNYLWEKGEAYQKYGMTCFFCIILHINISKFNISRSNYNFVHPSYSTGTFLKFIWNKFENCSQQGHKLFRRFKLWQILRNILSFEEQRASFLLLLTFSHLIIHLQVEEEYRAPLTLQHLLGLDNDTGNQTVEGGLLLEEGLGQVEELLVLLVLLDRGLVGLGVLKSHSTPLEVRLTELTGRKLNFVHFISLLTSMSSFDGRNSDFLSTTPSTSDLKRQSFKFEKHS